MFKRMMVLGAMASALAFTGCQNRSQEDAAMDRTAVPADTTLPPATGGSGASDYSTGSPSGSTNLEDTTQSQDIDDGADMNTGGAGGSGTVTPVEPDTGSNVNGTGGSGSMDSTDSFGGTDSKGDLNNAPPANTADDLGGTGGAGMMDDSANTSHPDSSMEHSDTTK
ncbi:hypothetical protein SAMN05444354_103202 [Stigmatella aurantiaca]|uniref:Lipoprotein n=1 Tax=Stigmatella aurantiaca TaxID=41 RepID=A0A1H7LDG6_STIAU|nr:hypothetical protein [Stigmatella aurantiaca]SEK96856.1 hypothetical protein SAMN05444354_103202 [Stigmatella aurantiaca]